MLEIEPNISHLYRFGTDYQILRSIFEYNQFISSTSGSSCANSLDWSIERHE